METTSRTCRWVCRRLPLLAGGDLVGSERRRVERHLISCPICRSRRVAGEQSLAVLREVAALGVAGARSDMAGDAPSLWPALARQIREAKHRPERSSVEHWVRFGNTSPLVGWISVGLAATLVLGCGWFWSNGLAKSARSALPLNSVQPGMTSVAPAVVVEEDPETLIAGNDRMFRLLNEYDAAALRLNRRSSALPEVNAAQGVLPTKRGLDPFEPPLNLRLDYDLDWGTLSGPALNTQRAY